MIWDVNLIGAQSYGRVARSDTDKRVTAITVNLTRIAVRCSKLNELYVILLYSKLVRTSVALTMLPILRGLAVM